MLQNRIFLPSIDRMQVWMESTRPATLPLALASILMGSALAAWQHAFDARITALAILTALLLQILSNLANDYGDAMKGGDRQRIGPLRGLQKGLISREQMRWALGICVLLCAASGSALIALACRQPTDIIGFLVLGAAAIVAAITYTVGRKPYGYIGLGDLSVLVFFGWLGVMGTYYLQTGAFLAAIAWPATACGLMSAAVLNINNMRDIETDRQNGKITLAVRLGPVKARYYHIGLLTATMICLIVFAAWYLHSLVGWSFLLAIPLFFLQGRQVLRQRSPEAMRPLLKSTVKIVLLTSVLFAFGASFSA